MPAPIAFTNTQIINYPNQVKHNNTQTNDISIEVNKPQEEQKLKTISETESQFDSDSSNEDSRDQPARPKSIKLNLTKKIKTPNLLVKSTNIQKNYAKAMVSYACRQRALVFETLGEQGGEEFLKLMIRLKNRLRNVAHITRFTHVEEFLSLFRILGNNFMKKDSVSYIYNSKIQQKSCHLSNMTIVRNSLLKY
ncbi:unnamed protein product (macronuclear) [Paramecium tetraurelia]|uniref:Uncharacterized protein n=1 Tax=Paramecium tetraurelia TaxID=5888 RepID=A0E333_PARTE|nr:uncharacterized protein GSPATT00022873001 [Paramecium tetraurelia]CAK89700.1 unnamed protein product [Paramecium tetraurelia]|eukprot:XP_001457097.1 hypothetical protein (macronuclear) [Paramecium tetraurelia strain d4-2]